MILDKYNIGIYKIQNLFNGKVYIGQSMNLKLRIETHKRAKSESYIHKSIRKYGVDNFSFEVLLFCDTSSLDFYEILMIEHFDSFKSGYNLTSGGLSCGERSKETKFAISEKHKKLWSDPKFRSASLSRLQSEEVKNKRAESLKKLYTDCCAAREVSSSRMKRLFEDDGFRLRNLNNLNNLRSDQHIEQKRLSKIKDYWSDNENKAKHTAVMQAARNENTRLSALRKYFCSQEFLNFNEKESERLKTYYKDELNKNNLVKRLQGSLTEEVVSKRNNSISKFWGSEESVLTRKAISDKLSSKPRPVLCVNTGQVFLNLHHAGLWVMETFEDVKRNPKGSISRVCSGERSKYKGLSWEFVQQQT